MGQHILIIGAGLIGVTLALQLRKAEARVTLIDRARPGAGASGTSFGWINASFFKNDPHHRLRVNGIAAYHRLAADVPTAALRWQSCLWFEKQGAELAEMKNSLSALNYPVEYIEKAEFSRLEPALKSPQAALHFTAEAVADPAELTRDLYDAACALGARAVLGVAVTGLIRDKGRVHGVTTAQGDMTADHVVLAAGTGAAALANIPMLDRPGLLMKTQILPPLLSHVLVTPEGEIKQDAKGHLVMPTVAGHQSDETTDIKDNPAELADAALARLQSLFPHHPLFWSEIAQAHRPMPKDGLPVIGAIEPGLYATVMHSGVTLAAITAELATQEIMAGAKVSDLAPYRPDRF